MKQELPNLVDERRFRRREEQPQVERDEYGRVGLPVDLNLVFKLTNLYLASRENGPRSESLSIWSQYLASICELRLSARAEHT